MKRILVLGDSLSDGFRLNREEAYPAILADKLREAGLEFEILNASASGGTTDGGLRRLPPHLKHRIDILILELGINDAFQGRSIASIESNLQAIIDQVRSRNPNVRIVIAGMQLPQYTADDYVSAFGKMYVDLAAKNDAALVPYYWRALAAILFSICQIEFTRTRLASEFWLKMCGECSNRSRMKSPGNQ